MIEGLSRFLIRISAFPRKEIFEILRQPRLVLTLVLGPFLILLTFGLGYRVQAQPLRALFVLEEDNPFHDYLDEYVAGINPLLEFAGESESMERAQQELLADNVDIVVALPESPIAQIRDSQQAPFEIYHNEIDPFQVDYIEAFARIYTDEVNRRVVAAVASEGQQQSADVQAIVIQARVTAERMHNALQEGDIQRANRLRTELSDTAALLSLSLGTSAELLQTVEDRFGEEGVDVSVVSEQLESIQESLELFTGIEPGQSDYSEEIAQAERIADQFNGLENVLADFRTISPAVLISPFRSDVTNIGETPPRVSDYYVPAAIALVAQHLAITFAALSIVRERHEGTVELFRVSPLSALETLLGKYISYFLFLAVLVAALTALVVLGLQLPMPGRWVNYAVVIALLLFASLGVGFVISLMAENTSQAVQFSMILLLASIFFSGFFLTLQLLRPVVQIISWLLPATYAIQMLQDVMLRGIFRDLDLLANLGLIGLAFFFLAWFLLRLRMARR